MSMHRGTTVEVKHKAASAMHVADTCVHHMLLCQMDMQPGKPIPDLCLPALGAGRSRSASLLASPLLARVQFNLPPCDEGSAQRRPQAMLSDLHPCSWHCSGLAWILQVAVWAGALLNVSQRGMTKVMGYSSPAKRQCSRLETARRRL